MATQLNIWCGQLNPEMGHIKRNRQMIMDTWQTGRKKGADLVIVPELAICGYPPEDLLLKKDFITSCMNTVRGLAKETQDGPPLLVGTPWKAEGFLFNAAVLLKDGMVNTIACKRELPNYGVFDERRYFEKGPGVATCQVMGKNGEATTLGIAICEDLWFPGVAKELAAQGAEAIVSVNASPYEMDKAVSRRETVRHRVEEVQLPVLYVNMWGGQDELVFDGRSFATNPGDGGPAFVAPAFADSQFHVEIVSNDKGTLRFECGANFPDQPKDLEDIYRALCCGFGDYVKKNGFKNGVVVGLSGGVDSALAAAIAAHALGPDKVVGLLMPSPYSSDHSISDAEALAKNLGIKTHTVPIEAGMKAFDEMLADVFKGTKEDVTEENVQARLRGVILMAFSNKFGHMLMTTGNKSEMSVGYATLYGDMNGGYNPLKDVYKTTVFDLCRHLNRNEEVIPHNIITKPPSAELRPDQQDSDSLPDYDTLDGILTLLIEQRMGADEVIEKGYDGPLVRRVVKMLRRNEYKRRQAPPGVKITSLAFGKDFRFPITNHWFDEEQA